MMTTYACSNFVGAHLAHLCRFRDEGDDRTMVASRAQIEAEERRSARMGRSEDERAAAEEARAAAAKAEKKRRRKGDSSFVLV